MDRNEALHILADEHFVVAAGQTFSIDLLDPDDPADANGVARLFYAIYGDGYPVDTVYIPERLIDENRSGRLRSAVARADESLPGLEKDSHALTQFFVDRAAHSSAVVDPLRSHGFLLGGLPPVCFGCLSMHSERAHRIADLVRSDRETNARRRPTPRTAQRE